MLVQEAAVILLLATCIVAELYFAATLLFKKYGPVNGREKLKKESKWATIDIPNKPQPEEVDINSFMDNSADIPDATVGEVKIHSTEIDGAETSKDLASKLKKIRRT